MTRDFPPVLARLIPLLASPVDGEVIATARAIERTLRSASLDWHDLSKALTAAPPPLPSPHRPPCRAETHEATETRFWLEAVARESWPNDWTRKFVASLLARPSLDRLSKKQVACANNIVAEAFRRGVWPEARRRRA
jgi:hypothetical protein